MGEAFDIIRNLVSYRRSGRLDVEGLKALQLARFREMVRHAMDHTAFYARLYEGVDPDRVVPEDLPVVTKDDLVANFHDFLADDALRLDELREWVKDPDNFGRYFRDEYVVFHTSGTTGQSTVMVYDREAFSRIKAVGLVRGFDRPASPWTALKAAVNPVRSRFAVVVIDGGLYPSVTNFLYMPKSTRVFFEIRIFSLFTPMEELVRELNDYQPWFLIGYPSVIAALAYEQRAGRLHILEDPPRRSVATLSEPLLPQVRRVVKEVWGLPVIDTYGTGECLPLARGCSEYGNLHVNEDMVHVEVVDERKIAVDVVDERRRPVPAGIQGRSMLVSNLFNHAQPFLRYEVSDMVTLSTEPCPCGSALARLESVQGRTEEMIWLRDADGERELLHPYLFVVSLFRVPSVREYQVEQVSATELLVRVEPVEGETVYLDDVRAEVARELRRTRLRNPPEIGYQLVDHIGPDPETGKVRRVLPLSDGS